MSQSITQIFVIKHTIIIRFRQRKHLSEFFIIESISISLQNLRNIVLMNKPLIFRIKNLESLQDNIFRVSTVQFIGQHGQKDGKVDGSTSFASHLFEFFLVDVSDTEGSVSSFQVTDGDDTVS